MELANTILRKHALTSDEVIEHEKEHKMRFRRNDKQDRQRSEMAAANRIRNLGGRSTYVDVDPEEVNRRLRNMTYGSTDSRISATRPDYEPPQLYRASEA